MTITRTRRLPALLLLTHAIAAHAAEPPAVSDAWARATPPGVDVGAVYLAIQGGGRDDRLVGASTVKATMTHLHEVVEGDGVAKMRSVDSVAIPAGQRVTFAPKGLHIMLMGLSAPLVTGQSFPLVLEFAESPAQTVTVTVRAATDDGGGHAQH